MRRKLLLMGLLGIFIVIALGCGKKAAPTPRDQVLEKQAQKQPPDKK